ncbi:hypothetical protein AAHE18_05G168000 [Arachis hypogaea]
MLPPPLLPFLFWFFFLHLFPSVLPQPQHQYMSFSVSMLSLSVYNLLTHVRNCIKILARIRSCLVSQQLRRSESPFWFLKLCTCFTLAYEIKKVIIWFLELYSVIQF